MKTHKMLTFMSHSEKLVFFMCSFREGVSVQDEPSLSNVETFLRCSSLTLSLKLNIRFLKLSLGLSDDTERVG